VGMAAGATDAPRAGRVVAVAGRKHEHGVVLIAAALADGPCFAL